MSGKILFVAGARPNFIKMAPLMKLFMMKKITFLFCNTKQHYDLKMNLAFIREFQLRDPDYVGIENTPKEVEWAFIFGDVDGSRIAAEWLHENGIKIIHIESGLRSFDKTMPEENNRIIIDWLSDIRFVTEQSGIDNLLEKDIKENNYLVGNTMIDSLAGQGNKYILCTLHRPSNVDDPDRLRKILFVLDKLGYPIMFPKHHRVKMPEVHFKNIHEYVALDYEHFTDFMRKAALIITDSGGVQEEAAWLNRKCLTLRENTERPITLDYGNELVNLETLVKRVKEIMDIPLWDGKASERIFQKLIELKIIKENEEK